MVIELGLRARSEEEGLGVGPDLQKGFEIARSKILANQAQTPMYLTSPSSSSQAHPR